MTALHEKAVPVSNPASCVTKALASWPAVPDWVLALAEACDASSQGKVAVRLGCSKALVSRLIRNDYAGAAAGKTEAAVRRVLMDGATACPVLGSISGERCLSEQRRPFDSSNHLTVRLWRACRGGCPHFIRANKGGETHDRQ
jgi:hypothetical protein